MAWRFYHLDVAYCISMIPSKRLEYSEENLKVVNDLVT